MILGMEQVQRCFERYGRVWRCPQACTAGRCGDRARWIQIRDGLRECIEFLPLANRSVETKLQEAWMYAANQVEIFEEESKGEWLIPMCKESGGVS